MATYNTPLITTQGLSLLKAEIAGNDSVTFTKIVFSSDDYSQTADSSVQALTTLSSLDLTATARSFTDVNGNLKIRGVANNQNTTSAFYIKTYGLYGKNKAGNEMLIAVSTAQNANFVPAYNGKQTNQIAYTFNIAISSTNNITLSSSTDVSVTQADIATINNAVNSNASSLTAQQSSYAGSASSAINSNASNIASNSTNISSLQSSVSTNSSAIASNANNISSLQSSVANNSGAISGVQGEINSLNALTSIIPRINQQKSNMFGTDFNSYMQPGTYTVYAMVDNLPNGLSEGVLIVNMRDSWSEQMQMFYDRKGNMYFRGFQSYPTPTWDKWTVPNNISSEMNNITSSVAANSSAIASNATNLSSAISSVSVSNNAVSSSIASTVSTNQSSIATNSNAISSLQTSVANNSLSIANNTSQIAKNDTINTQQINQIVANIQNVQNQVTSNNVVAMNYKGTVPSTTLSNVWQTGYYDLGGQMFTDGPYGSNVAMYGQMTIMTTGGVTTQQIIDNGGGFYTRALNSWGITPWVKH